MVRLLRSASAVERTHAATEFIDSFPPATELILVGASREAVDDLVRGFVPASGATFGLHRFSLIQLAARLAMGKLAGAGIAPLSAVGAEALAARAAFEAISRHDLNYFAPIARFPGFARAAARTMADLRSGGIAPGRLQELQQSGPDNAALLHRFEEQMVEAALGDQSLLFENALEAVRQGAEFARHPIVFLDVPLHSAIERAFVVALTCAAKQALFTCPTGDLRTLENFKTIPGLEQLSSPSANHPSSLARLGSYLFTESAPPEGKPDEEVVFFSAPGEERESVEIARRILAEAEKGTSFDRMAVLLRAPESYSHLIEAALRRAGIPVYFARGSRRPDPSGRALLALLACAAEGLSARRFAEYLSFTQVPDLADDGSPVKAEPRFAVPEDDTLSSLASRFNPQAQAASQLNEDSSRGDADAPQLAGALRAPWKWEQLLVEGAVIGGKERWERRLSGLENQFTQELEQHLRNEPESPRVEAVKRKLRNLQHLRAFALPVIEQLASLPESATWGDWIMALEGLIPQVLRQPERVGAVLADMKPMGPVGSVTLAEVQSVLEHWLVDLQQQPPKSRYGRVLVAIPEQARGRSFDVVFVPGLAERVFPQKLREDPLLLDSLRHQLSSDLPVLRDRSQQERLLLHIAIGAARSRLYLSYPRLEVGEARARVPSFYALDVARSITGHVPDYNVLAREAELAGASRLAWPAPRDRRMAIDDAEYDLSTALPLLTTRQPRAGRLAYVMTLNPSLARSLRGRWARWQEKWSEYDGLYTKRPAIGKILDSERLRARPYSVSALQNFAACPYRFLLSSIYRLEPREVPAPLEEMDPLTKGALFHRIQADLQRELKEKGLLPVQPAHLAQALTLLEETIRRIAQQAYEELAPAIERVWLDAIDTMRLDLRVWLEKVAQEDGWIPVHFEFGFGLAPSHERDPASCPEPVLLSCGAVVHGVIDLIERSGDGKLLRVTDHKTGKARVRKGIVVGNGEYLQPVVYSLATEAALKQTVWEGRLFYCTSDGGFSEHSIPLGELARESAAVVLRTIDEGIAAPFLVQAPREDGCSYCDFQEVCGPYEEIRLTKKNKENPLLVQLKIMRDLA
jgi:ATP-dependent helicase/nuclease subunit B